MSKVNLSILIFISQNSSKTVKMDQENIVLDNVPGSNVTISIDKGIAKLLYPYQKEGIEFMWRKCFGSVDEIRESAGTGCILGHIMGLGMCHRWFFLQFEL